MLLIIPKGRLFIENGKDEKEMAKIRVEGNKMIFERRDELTVFEPYGPDCIRCRSTKNSRLSEESWTLLPAKEASDIQLEGDEKKMTLRNGMMSVTVDVGTPWYGGIITFYRKDAAILRTKYEGDYTCRNIHTEGDHYQVKVIFESNPGEHLHGLGQE